MRQFLFITFLVMSVMVRAQELPVLDQSVEALLTDVHVRDIVNKHMHYNTLKQGVDGYRVQIYFNSGNNSRELAMQIRADVVSKFQDIPAYVIWQQPNYKVRLGNCLSRVEAQRILDLVKPSYINAYIVKDVIDYNPYLASDSIR